MGGVDVLIYTLLFIGLYFEVFVLLTFLSAPARARRMRPISTRTPHVAMIVPCWNEEATIKENIESLLTLDYPADKLSVVVVNDGSTDRSGEILDREFSDNPRVKIVHQMNGGKHAALNAGIEFAQDAELVGCLDADSFVEKGALREIISCFDDPRVAAATVAMSVQDPKKPLEVMQHIEYILGIALRHILSAVNGIHVTPGPFSLYRRDIVLKVGGFRYGHQAEDMEMALRLQREGYWIDNAVKARVYTKVPTTVSALVKQRTRWTSGFLRNVAFDYRDLIANPRFGVLGLMVLPLGFLAIVGGVIVFALFVFRTVHDVMQSYTLHNGIPLSYSFSHVNIEWFYLPISVLSVLTLVSVGGIILFIVIGKKVSNTPGKLFSGILAFVLIYRFIATFWLIRSLKDVALGTRRPWR
jgi:cellulose synthase/poly-beta-1,6-N-acetylglucosamine synthase-like glycosyltransferase